MLWVQMGRASGAGRVTRGTRRGGTPITHDTAVSLGMEAGVTPEDYANSENGIQTESLEGWEEDLLEEFKSANNLSGSTVPDEEVIEEEEDTPGINPDDQGGS